MSKKGGGITTNDSAVVIIQNNSIVSCNDIRFCPCKSKVSVFLTKSVLQRDKSTSWMKST